VEFPLAEEYTTLIRFVGPMAGYLAAQRFVAALPLARLAAPAWAEVAPLLACAPPPALLTELLEAPTRYAAGCQLVAAAPVGEHAQNLACKFLEGLFVPCPTISDFLQFAHGPFQQTTARPHPVILLQTQAAGEAELVARSQRMLSAVGQAAHVVRVPTAGPLAIVGFEAAFNALIFAAMRQQGVNQVDWPGKGRDDALYGFCPDVGA
jgi:hypothetical protein